MAKNKQELSTVHEAILPVVSGASQELMDRMAEVKDNLESVETFKLPRAKMTAAGFELIEGEPTILELEGVMIHTKKTNVYYENTYNANEVTPPTCFSKNGEVPDDSSTFKQHATCKGCPKAEFGTNSMKSGKACRNLKPIFMLLSDESIMPRQLNVTPASLQLANKYLMNLTERGLSYRKVKTKIVLFKENPRDTYYKMRFQMGAKISEQASKNVEFLRTQWMPVMNEQGVELAEFTHEQTPQYQDIPQGGDY